MNLLTIAHVPAVQCAPEASVLDAIDASLPHRVGAVAVVDAGTLVGIVTERDVMLKVVYRQLPPDVTPVADVMTSPVVTVRAEMPPEAALQLMLERHIRHLPVSPDGRHLEGMLSIRNLLQHMVEHLTADLRHLEDYVGLSSRSA